MRRASMGAAAAAVILCLLAGAAAGAVFFPPAAAPDLSGYALQSQIPTPCATAPLPDTLQGAVGSGTPCTLRSDAARPTVVQAANVTTDAAGAWSVTWAKGFASATPVVNPLPVNTGALPVMCNVQARTATAASGKCWQANTNTLPGTLAALGGLVLNVFAAGAGNVPVMVIAREPTQ